MLSCYEMSLPLHLAPCKPCLLSRRQLLVVMFLHILLTASNAQVGEHRNTFSIGANAGYVLSNVGFSPSVPQRMHGGMTAGLSMRYVCEKYFSMICSVYGEVNYASVGWKQRIETAAGLPVVNENGNQESYSRTLNYVQIPIMAHLAWGREERGVNFFVQAGPQLGLFLSDKISKNYDNPNVSGDGCRGNTQVAQETKSIEKKFDYGIAAGLGIELSLSKAGHFILEGRYYYGLGNIYGNTKRDTFGKSNLGNIVIKAAYLFDVTR